MLRRLLAVRKGRDLLARALALTVPPQVSLFPVLLETPSPSPAPGARAHVRRKVVHPLHKHNQLPKETGLSVAQQQMRCATCRVHPKGAPVSTISRVHSAHGFQGMCEHNEAWCSGGVQGSGVATLYGSG